MGFPKKTLKVKDFLQGRKSPCWFGSPSFRGETRGFRSASGASRDDELGRRENDPRGASDAPGPGGGSGITGLLLLFGFPQGVSPSRVGSSWGFSGQAAELAGNTPSGGFRWVWGSGFPVLEGEYVPTLAWREADFLVSV